MMQLRFQTRADDWVRELCNDLSAQIRILGIKSIGSGPTVAHFIDVVTESGGVDRVRQRLGILPSVQNSDLTDLSRKHAIGVVVSSGCRVCGPIIGAREAMFVSSAATEDDCTVSYKIFLNNEGVPSLLKHLSRVGVRYRIAELSPISVDIRLTARQLNVLKSAMEMGLYDFPKRTTQEELASQMGIAPPTLNEILRRAEKIVLGMYLSDQTGAEAQE